MSKPAPRTGRRIGAIAASALVHIVVLTAVALHVPSLFIPSGPSGPPEPVIPLLLMPRLPPAEPSKGLRPGALRLHRRQLRPLPPDLPVAPLPVPEPLPAPPTPAPAALRPAPLPEAPRDELRAALRHSPIGCANPKAFQLSRAERDACDEQFAKGTATAAFPGLGLSAEKQVALDAAAQHGEACRAYRGSINGEQPRLRDGRC